MTGKNVMFTVEPFRQSGRRSRPSDGQKRLSGTDFAGPFLRRRQETMRHLPMLLAATVLAALALSAGCSWIGETAGRAKAGVENAISDTKSGYHKGYAEGKS